MRAQNANIVAIVKAIISLNRELFATILLALSRVCVCVWFCLCSSLPPSAASVDVSPFFPPKKKREERVQHRDLQLRRKQHRIANKVMKGTLMIPFSSILLLTFGLWKINFNPCRFNDLDYFSTNWISLGPRSQFISCCRRVTCSVLFHCYCFGWLVFLFLFLYGYSTDLLPTHKNLAADNDAVLLDFSHEN